MRTFLQMVAHDLYTKIGSDLSRTAIVFPNKRAGLFFNEFLAAESTAPLWSPAYVSISELLGQLSPWKKGDSIRLVCELYQIFREETGSEEKLDDFYFWGELLISDFDDADKNLVDTSRLFSNLQELKSIMEGYDFLDKEQEEAIRQFFHNFSIEKRTELKAKFISLWDRLGTIYRRYHERLAKLGIAYEGMMYREVIERLDTSLLPYDRYVFVGFNVLNQVETRFFLKLKEAGKALFYWDYDLFYTRMPREQQLPYIHEAGEFILRNLKLFPNELPEELFDELRRPKQIRYLSSPTENAQARYMSAWLREAYQTNRPTDGTPMREQETAVVLCNESLLLPVLNSIPECVDNVNITMGFPLSQTPVCSYIAALTEMQMNGYHADTGRYDYAAVQAVLRHPYTRRLSENAQALERQLTRDNRFYPLPSELKRDAVLELLFTPQTGNLSLCRWLNSVLREVSTLYRPHTEAEATATASQQTKEGIFGQLYRESIFKAYTLVTRLGSLIESGELADIQGSTFRRLLDRLLTAASIPFHGEPAIGMQIMGVLETRNLDFRHLLVLSLNEGKLPKSEGDSSFIPYNLRKAFGMTTIDHKNAVYAYYFYRMIQRAEHITLAYNTASDGMNRGEMSRFMLQLLTEWPHSIQRESLEAGQSPTPVRDICIEKSAEIMRLLYNRFDTRRNPDAVLSPSALNGYLDCPLLFYYRYVAQLKAPEEVSAEIDSALFGTLFHRCAEWIYTDLTANGKMVGKEDLERMLKEEHRLQDYVDKAFKELFFHVPLDQQPEYNGTQLIHSKVILSYIKQLLRNDLRYAPFALEGMEKRVAEYLPLELPQGELLLKLGGTIDRLDSKGDTLRIVDYKTGGVPHTPENIEQLFTPSDNRAGYILQTFLYAAILCRKQPLKVTPSLLYIHRAASEDYSPVIEIGSRSNKTTVCDFAVWEREFRERLQQLLMEIFTQEKPFTQTTERRRCEYCDFRSLCGR